MASAWLRSRRAVYGVFASKNTSHLDLFTPGPAPHQGKPWTQGASTAMQSMQRNLFGVKWVGQGGGFTAGTRAGR